MIDLVHEKITFISSFLNFCSTKSQNINEEITNFHNNPCNKNPLRKINSKKKSKIFSKKQNFIPAPRKKYTSTVCPHIPDINKRNIIFCGGTRDEGRHMGWLKKASRKLVTAVAMTHPRTLASPPPTTLPTILIFNYKTPHLHTSTLSPHLNLRPPPRLTYAPPLTSAASKTMSTEAALDHDTLKKQKRILRTKVKSDLKSMDPAQRAQEGTSSLHFLL